MDLFNQRRWPLNLQMFFWMNEQKIREEKSGNSYSVFVIYAFTMIQNLVWLILIVDIEECEIIVFSLNITLPCLAIVWIRNSVRTLSTLGTKMELYSGVISDGYTYSSTRVCQWTHWPRIKGIYIHYHTQQLPTYWGGGNNSNITQHGA